MASFLDKFKVKTAIETNTTLDLSCQHITTANWMELQPVYIKEMVPGETIEVLQQTFTRLAPLAVPTLGRANIHNRAFFVPMRTIFPRWDDFITQSKSGSHVAASGLSNSVQVLSTPSVDNGNLVRLFLGDPTNDYQIPTASGDNRNTSFVTEVTGDTSNADIIVNVIPPSATSVSQIKEYAYNFTAMGRNVNKILQSLGYNIIWSANYKNSTAHPNLIDYNPNPKFSALPILGLFKIFIDWYWPAQYVGDTAYNFIDSVISLDNYSSVVQGVDISSDKLYKLFTFNGEFRHKLSVNYDSDYLVSAFDEPTGPASSYGGNSINKISDINIDNDNSYEGFYTTSEVATSFANDNTGLHQGTPNLKSITEDMDQGVQYPGPVTQFALNALKAMTDYMQRHNLVGVRALDRFYARFGISLSNEKLKRSNYIGAQNIPLQFGDVMSNADTDGAALGSYAGKGLGYGEDKFTFKSEDYGYFIICSSIVPVANTFEGVNRMVMHRSPLDFWTPEYDQLGNQAISKMEVYVPMNDSAYADGTPATDYNRTDLATGIFGYTPRYSEYKVGLDKVTGDFRCKSLSNVGETSSAWYLNRSLDDTFQVVDNMVHSKFFVNGGDSDQFNRIFNIESDDNDKFYMIHNFNVTSNSPMHSLYDSYEFDSKGKTVVADVNGVKVN